MQVRKPVSVLTLVLAWACGGAGAPLTDAERQAIAASVDSATRAFEAAQGVGGEGGIEPFPAAQQRLAEHGQALAEGGGLGRHMMGAPDDQGFAMLLGGGEC